MLCTIKFMQRGLLALWDTAERLSPQHAHFLCASLMVSARTRLCSVPNSDCFRSAMTISMEGVPGGLTVKDVAHVLQKARPLGMVGSYQVVAVRQQLQIH